MNHIHCRLCKSEARYLFSEKILSKYLVEYFVCSKCKGIQVENPFWLDESYDESINLSDTGILTRNIRLMKLTTIFSFLFINKNKNSKYLDYGGGYGVFVRLMRDVGLDYYWKDPYTSNYFLSGFEGNDSSYKLITCFEVLEHAVHPSDIFDYLVSKTDMIIFTTLMYGNTPPGKNEWDYYAFTHGQHVFFYNIDTLKYIARKYNLNLISDKKDFHILSKKKIPNIYLYLTKVFYKIGLFSIVKIRIKSKTLDDSNLMKKIE